MTRDEIIRLAREAGWNGIYSTPLMSIRMQEEDFLRFAALVAAAERAECVKSASMLTRAMVLAEREECAKECEALRPSKPEYDQRFYDGCTFSAHAIRARGQE